MSQENQTYAANYFFRDYVTEDIVSYCIGETYLYHYKETLIGTRCVRDNVGYFLDFAKAPKQSQLYAPTLDQLTEEHIKECVDEIDHSSETTNYVPMEEVMSFAQELVTRELSLLIDNKLTGKG